MIIFPYHSLFVPSFNKTPNTIIQDTKYLLKKIKTLFFLWEATCWQKESQNKPDQEFIFTWKNLSYISKNVMAIQSEAPRHSKIPIIYVMGGIFQTLFNVNRIRKLLHYLRSKHWGHMRIHFVHTLMKRFFFFICVTFQSLGWFN